MQENLIKVLWVEDELNIIEDYRGEAYNHGIHLIPFTNWDEAEAALKKDFDQWSAIILDAKCCLHADSADNAQIFLTNVFASITKICSGKTFIPWYVLSGQAEDNITNLILESRKDWDGDWKKAYYDKGTDRLILYQRIKDAARKFNSANLKIHEMYTSIFKAIDATKLHDDVDEYLTDLLAGLHFSKQDDKDYNDKYKKVRLIIEHLFRSMIDNGLLPPQKKINLKCSNLILSGYSVTSSRNGNKSIIVEVNTPVFPKIIQDNVIHMIHTVGSDLHTESKDDTDTKHLHDYLNNIGHTSYLLQSYALQLCDIILWYKNYIANHPDKEINALNWEIKDRTSFSQIFR